MGLDIQRLYSQGRAKSGNELWSPEEWEAVLAIEARGVARTVAADYVRNGVMTVEDFDKAVKTKFKPEKLDEVLKEATDGLKDNAKKLKGKKK